MTNQESISEVSLPAEQPFSNGKAPLRVKVLGFAFVLVLLCVCAVLVEVGLRFTNIGKVSNVMSVGDPDLGFGPMLANKRSPNYFPEYKSGYIMMTTNNGRFLEDVPTEDQKAPGTTRIFIFGDSQTACGCENAESYTNQAEAGLNKMRGVAYGAPNSYEMINGGVGRYSPYQYFVRAKIAGLPRKPDRIIFGIYLGNDLLDSGRNDDRPYLVKQADGSFIEKPPEYVVFQDPKKVDDWLYSSRTLNLIRDSFGYNLIYQYSRFQMLRKNIESTGNGSIWDVTSYMKDIYKLTNLSRNMVTQAVNQHHWFLTFPQMKQKDLEIQREILRRSKELFAKEGVEFSVLMIPAKPQIEPELIQDVFAKMNSFDSRLSEQSIVGFLDEYAENIKKFGKELDIEVYDPRQALLAGKKGRELYYRDDMHLNVAGNAVLGQFLAAKLYTPASGAASGSQGKLPSKTN